MELTDFQKWAIRMTDKGAGLDASRSAMKAQERRECEALVAAGLLSKTKNHSKDTTGMYVKFTPTK